MCLREGGGAGAEGVREREKGEEEREREREGRAVTFWRAFSLSLPISPFSLWAAFELGSSRCRLEDKFPLSLRAP